MYLGVTPNTHDSKQQSQATLTPPPTPPSSSPTPPTPTSPYDADLLAREERRRKRDERRAARQQTINEEKYMFDTPMLPEEHLNDRCKVTKNTLNIMIIAQQYIFTTSFYCEVTKPPTDDMHFTTPLRFALPNP